MTTTLSTMARLAVDPDRLGAHLREKRHTTGSASDDELVDAPGVREPDEPDEPPGVREPEEPDEPPGVREPDEPSGVREPDDAD